MRLSVVFGAALLAAWLLTGFARRYAVGKRMLDVPTARSSHTVPTPRGGGIGIALPSLIGIAALALGGPLAADVAIALCGGGALVALVGWFDDRYGLPKILRLLVHVVAAVWAVAWLGGLPALDLGGPRVQLGTAGSIAAVIGTVGAINIYNFMDGIDGVAGAEAFSVAVVAAPLLVLSGDSGIALATALVAGSTLGFLLWNWPPAKIFMGDAGSGLLGFLFAGLAMSSENHGSLPALVWATLLAVFIVDGVFTILRRALRGEPVHVAHRKHAYQRLVRSGRSHAAVTVAVLLVNAVLGLIAIMAVSSGRVWECALLAFLLVAGMYVLVDLAQPFDATD